jgi:hypothetical protein
VVTIAVVEVFELGFTSTAPLAGLVIFVVGKSVLVVPPRPKL